MVPSKRKRPHEEAVAEAPTRRATRQTAPEGTEPEKQLRSGRIRANTNENPTAEPSSVARSPPSSNDATRAQRAAAPVPAHAPPTQPPAPAASKTTRRTSGQGTARIEAEKSAEEAPQPNPRPKQTAVPPPTIPVPAARPPAPAPKTQANTSRPRTHVPAPRPPQPRPQAPADTAAATTTTNPHATTPRRRTSTAAGDPATALPPTPAQQRSDRNVDRVVLGDVCFRTWYPSYYSILPASNGGGGGGGGGGAAATKMGGGKKDKEVILERLYICPCCFKYSKELDPWRGHVKFCEKKAHVPGVKVYTHPQVTKLGQVGTNGGPLDGDGDGEGEGEGEWSVWEVDGEQDGLFCQNLSLFAKFFLDNKSVFYDVTGFNYFLLVYTPSSGPQEGVPPRPHICGFFSKEKMSWDNNNLACILVFPPWQRKGLGALLMGVSYEISRREGVLGGPEKPISELGRKGYKRFWAGEIARWLLTLKPADGSEVRGGDDREILVDVEDCSKATWIVQEDCLAVLRDMGLVEEAGTGPPKQASSGTEETEEQEIKEVARVKIDKAVVRKWVEENKMDLERVCDPDGFVEGYAIKETPVEMEE